MGYEQATFLALIEGVSEFLPISSTAHLVLASNLLGIEQSEFTKSFEIIIQFGAILSVVAVFFKKIISDAKLWRSVAIAFIPTGVVGFLFYKVVKEVFLAGPYISLVALFLGGVAILIIEAYYKKRGEPKASFSEIENLSVKKALGIGVIQSISVVPGVSRAAATIFGGMALGLSRKSAVEMSFVLAVPTIAAAAGYDLLKSGLNFTSSEYVVLGVGFVVSFVSALVAVVALLKFVSGHSLVVFGWYRIILSILMLILLTR